MPGSDLCSFEGCWKAGESPEKDNRTRPAAGDDTSQRKRAFSAPVIEKRSVR